MVVQHTKYLFRLFTRGSLELMTKNRSSEIFVTI